MRFEEALTAMRNGKKVVVLGKVDKPWTIVNGDIVRCDGLTLTEIYRSLILLDESWEIFGEEEKQETTTDITLKSYEAKLLWEEIERLKKNIEEMKPMLTQSYVIPANFDSGFTTQHL